MKAPFNTGWEANTPQLDFNAFYLLGPVKTSFQDKADSKKLERITPDFTLMPTTQRPFRERAHQGKQRDAG